MTILKFPASGNDWSSNVIRKGYGWKRNDLDSEKTRRTKAGVLRRDKIGTKRTLTFEAFNLTRKQLAALDDDLSPTTFSATYLDIHGEMTKTFYCSSFTASLEEVQDGVEVWGHATFTLVEV